MSFFCAIFWICSFIDINLLDDDLSLEQKKRKIESFFDRKHFEACMYCDGFNDKYQRHTPAEQIKQLDDGDKQ